MKTNYFKCTLAVLILLIICLTAFCQTTSVWNGTSGLDGKYPDGTAINKEFGKKADGSYGNGTTDNPYLITNASELAYLSLQTHTAKGPVQRWVDTCFMLTIDIDLNDKAWQPIGGVNFTHTFAGNFDGGKKTISNISVVSEYDFSGLFGLLDNASISNVWMNNGIVSGVKNVGGIAGAAMTSKITNCKNIGVYITAKFNCAGGIVGECDSGTEISTSINTGTLEAIDDTYGFNSGTDIGGITGSTATEKDVIKNCANYGDIRSIGGKSGGIVGENYGTVNHCFNNGRVNGESLLYGYGGIVGVNFNTVKECFNTATISGSGEIGGIVGYSNTGKTGLDPKVTNCYNAGAILSERGSVGGIIGRNSIYGTVDNVYNIGTVESLNQSAYKGEIAGESENSELSAFVNCYYDKQFCHTDGAVDNLPDIGGGKSTIDISGTAISALFTDQSLWGFEDEHYPQLKGSLSTSDVVTSEKRLDISIYSSLFTAIVQLADNEMRWDNITSSFLVATRDDIMWNTSNHDIVNISSSIASITPIGGSVNLVASLNSIERIVPIVVTPSVGHSHSNKVVFTGKGTINAQGRGIPNNGVVELRHLDVEQFEIIPSEGYYLSELKFVAGETTYNALSSTPGPAGSRNEFAVDYDRAVLLYIMQSIDGVAETELHVTFTPVEVWDGIWTNEKEPFSVVESNGDKKYLAYRPCELSWLMRNVEESIDSKVKIKLANHVDMGGHNWGNLSTEIYNEYNGEFDGNGKTVYNLSVTDSNTNSGFFGTLGEDAYVHNFGVIGYNIVGIMEATGSNEICLGAIAGLNKGKISQCYSSTNIISARNEAGVTINIGGLVGKNEGKVEYSYCYGSIRYYGPGTKNMGGIIGLETSVGSSNNIFYDTQMTSIEEDRAIGNKANTPSVMGMSTISMISKTMDGKFSALNTLGGWFAQGGRYPVLIGSQGVNVVIINAMYAKLVEGENVDNVMSNFTLGSVKVKTDDNETKQISWTATAVGESGDFTDITSEILIIASPSEATSMVRVDRSKAAESGSLVALTAYLENVAYRRITVSVKPATGTYNLNVKIISGVNTDTGVLMSGGVDYTAAAKSQDGATVVFSIGSTAGFSIVPEPQRFMSSLTEDNTDKTSSVIVDYLAETLLYQVKRDAVGTINVTLTFAEVPPWNGNSSMVPHSNTNGLDYLIYHPEEFAWVANQAKDENKNNLSGVGFKMMNNINLNNKEWIPIGGGESGLTRTFNGEFDGNEKEVQNVTINMPNHDYVGLFGCVGTGGRLMRLSLVGCEIQGRNYVGAAAGYVKTGTGYLTDFNLDRCKVQNSAGSSSNFIKGTNNVGGIVGYHDYNGAVKECNNSGVNVEGTGDNIGGIMGQSEGVCYRCENRGDVKGVKNVGGIVGYNLGESDMSHVHRCVNQGKVTATGDRVGGVVGFSYSPQYATMIVRCVNRGIISGGSLVGGIVGENNGCNISQSYNLTDVTGSSTTSDGVGGIVGYNGNKSVEYCFNSGMIGGLKSVGGIAGRISNTSEGGVKNCYNLGIIKGDSYVGGIVGGVFGYIRNCYNAGNVKGKDVNELTVAIGAIAGYSNPSGVENCFYDKQMVVIKAVNNVDVVGCSAWLTTEIINKGMGFTDKSSWTYHEGLYPQLIVLDADIFFHESLLSPVFLHVNPTNPSDFETVRWLRSNFAIRGSNMTWTSDNTSVITISSLEATVVRPDADKYVTCTGTEDKYLQIPIRKVEFLVVQGDECRKIFRGPNGAGGEGNWNDHTCWFKGTPGNYALTTIPSDVTAEHNAIIDEGSTAVIKDGMTAISGQTQIKGNLRIEAGGKLKVQRMGNTDPTKVTLLNEKEKHASFILLSENSIYPMGTVKQAITTGTTNSKFQLISIPVPTLREGDEVISVFDGAWLDRYNQADAIWERYENEYYGKKYFDVERFRGYSVNYVHSDTTITFKGQIFVGPAVYKVNYDKTAGSIDYGGLNLIGNPYTTSMKIDWTKVTNLLNGKNINGNANNDIDDNVEENIWIWDSKNLQYRTYPQNISTIFNDGIIPACQGFWIRVKPLKVPVIDKDGNPILDPDGNPTYKYSNNEVQMSIPYTSVLANAQPMLKSSNDVGLSYIKLTVKGSKYTDEVLVLSSNECTDNYDNGWDGAKWAGDAAAPQVYAVEVNEKLAVDSKENIDETILAFEAGEDSQYMIESLDYSNVENVQLIDLKQGITHDILTSPYSFSASKQDVTNRFILKAKAINGVEYTDVEDWCKIFSYGKTVTVVGGQGRMEIIDMQGRIIKSISNINSDKCSLTVDKSGSYVVRVIGDNGIVSDKVIIN